MEEVVVTSRRRDESQQDVPLSVTAWGSEAIDQIKPTTLRDFDSLAPNVYIGMNTAVPALPSRSTSPLVWNSTRMLYVEILPPTTVLIPATEALPG
jgi:hypothetical protein